MEAWPRKAVFFTNPELCFLGGSMSTEIKKTVIQAIIRAFNAASKDFTRMALTHVLVQRSGDSIEVVGCDGYMISRVFIPEPEFSKLMKPGIQYLVAPDSLPMLKAILKDCKSIGICPARFDSDSIVFSNILGNMAVTVKTTKAIGFEYPDYERVIPQCDGQTVIGLNPEFLLDLFKALSGSKRPSVVLTIKDGATAVIVDAMDNDGNRQTGFLMPIRAA